MPRKALKLCEDFSVARQMPQETVSAAAATAGISAAIAVTATAVATAAAAQEKNKNDNPRAVTVREVASHVRFLLSSYTTYYGKRRKSVTSYVRFFYFLFASYPDKRKNEQHHGEKRGKREACPYIRAERIGNSAGERRA